MSSPEEKDVKKEIFSDMQTFSKKKKFWFVTATLGLLLLSMKENLILLI